MAHRMTTQRNEEQCPAAGPSLGFPSEGSNFFNTILDVCSNRGAKHEMGRRVPLAQRWRRPAQRTVTCEFHRVLKMSRSAARFRRLVGIQCYAETVIVVGTNQENIQSGTPNSITKQVTE